MLKITPAKPRKSTVAKLTENVSGSENTQANYRGHIQILNKWNAGEPVTHRRIAEYLISLGGKLSGATLNCRKSALKKAVKATYWESARDLVWLADLDLAFSEMRVPLPKCSVGEQDVLVAEDVNRLAASFPRKIGLVIRALFASGFRITELLTIRVRDSAPAFRLADGAGRLVARAVMIQVCQPCGCELGASDPGACSGEESPSLNIWSCKRLEDRFWSDRFPQKICETLRVVHEFLPAG